MDRNGGDRNNSGHEMGGGVRSNSEHDLEGGVRSITGHEQGGGLRMTKDAFSTYFENSSFNMLNFNYSTHKVKITYTTNRLSCNTELSLDDSEPTNHRRGRRQGNGYI